MFFTCVKLNHVKHIKKENTLNERNMKMRKRKHAKKSSDGLKIFTPAEVKCSIPSDLPTTALRAGTPSYINSSCFWQISGERGSSIGKRYNYCISCRSLAYSTCTTGERSSTYEEAERVIHHVLRDFYHL